MEQRNNNNNLLSEEHIAADLHIHTVASGHAYSSLEEVCAAAARKKLQIVAVTDHGPSMPGGTHSYYFGNMGVLPRSVKGVTVYSGIEANIISAEGEIDLKPAYLKQLDLVWAGLHVPCFKPGNRKQNTAALLKTLENPYVDGIVHPGNPDFEIDAEKVVLKALKEQKLIEINNSSLFVRPGSRKNCLEIASLVSRHGGMVAVNSDAHFSDDVGRVDAALELLKDAGFLPEQVINFYPALIKEYIEMRRFMKADL